MTPDQPRCTARRKHGQGDCTSFAMANGKCRVHGGASLGGIASPTLVTGRYSKFLPSRLIGRYEAARNDPELLALRDDIGLLDTRIGQVIEALDTGESHEAWVALMSTWSSFEESFQSLLDTGEVPEDMESKVSGIGVLIRSGLSEGYVWSEIRGLLKERAELVANERKRMVELQQYVTAEKALLFVSAVMDSVRRNVSDRDALAAISADIGRMADVRAGGQPAGVGGDQARYPAVDAAARPADGGV